MAADLVTDPPLPTHAGSPFSDVAVTAAMVSGVSAVAWWELAAAVTCGLLLASSRPVLVGNTSWFWAVTPIS